MFITQYELYDLAEILTIIRSNPKASHNIVILEQIEKCLKRDDISNNCLRSAVSKIDNINKSLYEFCFHENYYVNIKLYKNQECIKELLSYINNLKNLIVEKKYDSAFDLADAIHSLPYIIDEYKGKIPKRYYRIYLKPYKKKWSL